MLYIDWMTIDNLISMNCRRVFLPFTNLTSAYLCEFLKHWVNGGSPQLEWLTIGMDNIQEEEVFSGLEDHIRRTNNKREYKWKGDIHVFIEEIYTFDGLEIVSRNGIRASLKIRIIDDAWLKSELRMAVWHGF